MQIRNDEVKGKETEVENRDESKIKFEDKNDEIEDKIMMYDTPSQMTIRQ